jgi:hypothetical protein
MRTTIEVTNRDEGDQLRAGLDDPTVRAFVRVMGLLSALPSERARWRVMRFVDESLTEQQQPAPLDLRSAADDGKPA